MLKLNRFSMFNRNLMFKRRLQQYVFAEINI